MHSVQHSTGSVSMQCVGEQQRRQEGDRGRQKDTWDRALEQSRGEGRKEGRGAKEGRGTRGNVHIQTSTCVTVMSVP